MSGDVELNPGPSNGDELVSLVSISHTLSRLEQSQITVLAELSLIRAAQTNIEGLVGRLSSRVDALEKVVENNQSNDSSSCALKTSIEKFPAEIKALTNKCDDAENRLRRSNLIFFGIKDNKGETWAESETQIISFCSEKLGINLNPDDIEQAHRLGRFQADKKSPIVVKFGRFKVKSNILSTGPKLKDTSYAIRDDYSTRLQTARKMLFNYARERSTNFKIRFDKLTMNGRQFIYNSETNSLQEVQL